MLESMERLSAWTRPLVSDLCRVRTADLKRLHGESRGKYREAVSRELMRRSETGDVFSFMGAAWTVERKTRMGVSGVRKDGICTLRVENVGACEIASWA